MRKYYTKKSSCNGRSKERKSEREVVGPNDLVAHSQATPSVAELAPDSCPISFSDLTTTMISNTNSSLVKYSPQHVELFLPQMPSEKHSWIDILILFEESICEKMILSKHLGGSALFPYVGFTNNNSPTLAFNPLYLGREPLNFYLTRVNERVYEKYGEELSNAIR